MECENTRGLIFQVCRAIGFSLEDTAVTAARRLSGNSANKEGAPILVTFREEKLKQDFFDHKRKHGVLEASIVSEAFKGSTNRVSVRDEMTAFGRELLRYTKEVQLSLGFKYVWPGRNGKVLIRRQDGGKVEQIGTKQDLKLLTSTSSKRPLDASIGGVHSMDSSPLASPRTSPQIQKLNKRTR